MKEIMSTSHPLNAIANKFKAQDSREHAVKRAADPQRAAAVRTTGTCPALSLQHLEVPAMLIDSDLSISWLNQAALNRFPVLAEMAGPEVVGLLDWLLHPDSRKGISNWTEWTRFFLRQVRSLTSEQKLRLLLEQRSEEERRLLSPCLDGAENRITGMDQIMCQVTKDGRRSIFQVAGTTFDQGRLLVFEEIGENADEQDRSKSEALRRKIQTLYQSSTPVRSEFYALVARLNRSHILRAEMLDEAYSRMLRRLWSDAVEIMEQSGAVVAQNTGDELIGLFVPGQDQGEHNGLLVIQCALALKRRMGELGREWKIREGWLHDIELNIALDAGREYLIVSESTSGSNLIAAGDAVQTALRLARLALDGQIWATKRVISRVFAEDLNNICFGVFRGDSDRPIFVENSFSRLRDLVAGSDACMNDDGSERSVTQVFDHPAQMGNGF